MSTKIFAYSGNWTVQSTGLEGGIGIYEYNTDSGKLRYVDTVCKDLVAGFILCDSRHDVLYVADEQIHNPEFKMHGGGGRVFAFSIDPSTGMLKKLENEQPAFGTHTCYISIDYKNEFLVIANHGDKQAITKSVRNENGTYQVITEYSEVTAVLYPLGLNGDILPACDIIKFPHDTSVTPPNAASLHSVNFIPGSDFCVIASIKHDQVFMFRINRENKRLDVCDVIDLPSGYWPRHSAANHSKKIFYLNNEHSLHLTAVSYNENGKMTIVQQLDAKEFLAPEGFDRNTMQSDITISADGKYLYALCRGSNRIAVFSISEHNGELMPIQSLKLNGSGPRGMAISPDNKRIFVALQKSGLLSVLNIRDDGCLSPPDIADSNMSSPGNICFFVAGGAGNNGIENKNCNR